MLSDRKTVLLYIKIFVIQILMVLFVGKMASLGVISYKNLFNQRLLVFFLTPLYLYGIALTEKYMTIPLQVRIASRKKAMITRLQCQYTFMLVYWCVWFSAVMWLLVIKGENTIGIGMNQILGGFLGYILGYGVLANIIIIIGSVENKEIAKNKYLIAFLIFVLDIMVVYPEFDTNTALELKLLFSWILYGGVERYVVLFLWWVLSSVYIFKISVRKDIL